MQFYFMDGSGNNMIDPVAASKQKDAVTVFDYEIESLDALSKIQTGGFSIKGDQFVLNSVKLLTYADGEATSISEKLKVRSEKFATATDCYDLMGRKVAQPTRGLYIVNGKKVVIK